MLVFESDYIEGAHEEILRRLVETNYEKQSGYGFDAYCSSAKEKIKAACGCPDGDVYFLVGGTQTNATVIDSYLRSYEGVIAADTGHVSLHEAGAIEHSAHKVLTIPNVDGKLMPEAVENYLKVFYADASFDHMVFPGMVYISHPTELGTLYTAEELSGLSEVCRRYNIPLYLDGARLGYALASSHTDVTLPHIAKCCDAFYIGGTKVGALCGEAVVFPHGAPKHFFTMMKQHGALLAKGRLLGIQFDTLFTDDLYMNISRHAMEMAELLKKGFVDKGYELYADSPTNQQFVIITPQQKEKLDTFVKYTAWENLPDGCTVIRLATSWATRREDVEALLALI